MSIQIGDTIPNLPLGIIGPDGPSRSQAHDLMGQGKVVLFAVPGAFTPTCSARHLPGFIEQAAALQAKGVSRIVCLSVNDVFVMGAWGKHAGSGETVVMAADGNADFTKAMGLEIDASSAGMGIRSKRYAMLLQDGVVQGLWIDPPGSFQDSSAEAVLQQLSA